jgi:hypothetical protein
LSQDNQPLPGSPSRLVSRYVEALETRLLLALRHADQLWIGCYWPYDMRIGLTIAHMISLLRGLCERDLAKRERPFAHMKAISKSNKRRDHTVGRRDVPVMAGLHPGNFPGDQPLLGPY